MEQQEGVFRVSGSLPPQAGKSAGMNPSQSAYTWSKTTIQKGRTLHGDDLSGMGKTAAGAGAQVPPAKQRARSGAAGGPAAGAALYMCGAVSGGSQHSGGSWVILTVVLVSG